MATFYTLHPENPQERRIRQIVEELQDGAIMLYPTDTVYAIGCDLNSQSAVKRVRHLKRLSNNKPLTFLCSSLSNISEYAWVTDQAYRIMKRLIPGPYTFLLPTTKQVPRIVMAPKRRTTGIRVPNHSISQAILKELGNPVISTSAHIPDEEGEFPTLDMEKNHLFDALEPFVDIVIDSDLEPGVKVSTILDFTTEKPSVVRKGLGWEAVKEIIPID